MKRSHARRLVTLGRLSVGVCATGLLVHCSGGERPPPAQDTTVDAGPVNTGPNGPSIVGYDPNTGILFGENGLVNCGAQAPAQTITLKNPSDDIVNFQAKITVGDQYSVSTQSGGVPARGKFDLQITSKPMPGVSDVAPDVYLGTLQVKFETVDSPINIPLHQTARGAIVSLDFSNNTYAFGDVKVNTSKPKSFSLTNKGNLDVTANLQVGNEVFTINGASTASIALAGGKTISQTLTFEPTELVTSTDTMAVTFNPSAVHCGPVPGNVSISGNGTSSVVVQPGGPLNFGLVNCGGDPAAPQTVNITTTSDMHFTPQLGGGTNSSFSLANDANGTAIALGSPIPLAANGTYVMRIVPKKVPIPSPVDSDALGDTLTITTDVPLDKPHAVTLQETAQGAILSLTPQQIVQTGGINAQLGVGFTIVNAGNTSAPYSVAVTSDGPPGSFSSTLTSGTAAAGSLPGLANLTMPTSNGASYHGTLTLTAPGAVLCRDLPPAMPITATASGTAITTLPSSLDFGFVNCNSAAPFKTITISSTATTDITPTLGAGASSPFTLADNAGAALPNPIHIDAGGSFVMRVVPKTIPIPSPVSIRQLYPAGVGDQLTLTSTVDPPKVIRIDQTAQGAIFAFSPQTISASGTVQLTNTGNAAGAWTISGSGATSIPASGTLGTSPTNSVSLSITRASAGSLSIVAPSTVVCADLPTLTIN